MRKINMPCRINDRHESDQYIFLHCILMLIFTILMQRALPTSRRSSITTNFMAEETRREKELEEILESRLNDLKLNTKNLITGLPTR